MPDYDSDSSDGEGDYTETNVLLGYASKEATDDAISHLGGHPAWLDDKTTPPAAFAKCKVCNDLLSLLLELNGDLPARFPGHERRLYLLGCRRKACRRKEGSIRGIRAIRASAVHEAPVRAPSPPPPELPKQNLGSSIFGAKPPGAPSSNPFSSSSPASQASNPFAAASSLAAKPPQRPADPSTTALAQTFADKARISAPPPPPAGPQAPWPPLSAFPKPYTHYFLDADYESLDSSPPDIPQQVRVLDAADTSMDLDPGPASTKDADAAESAMDRAFQRFADRVGQNPEQVLRYEFAGRPLLYARDDALAARFAGAGAGMRCAACGAARVFELQLAPHAIAELEADEDGVEGMEWGTVILGVCGRDCVPAGVGAGEVGYVEEWVGVQWEEVVTR